MIAETKPRSAEDIRAAWRAAHVKPAWEIPATHAVGRVPSPLPGHWPWRLMEPLVNDAAELTDAAMVERRVLTLNATGNREDEFHTVTNLNAAFQILLPGEAARPHRHSANALRFVLAGNGAVTRVDGKEAPMNEGDLVLTPGWCWHEHWHAGDGPIVWLDVLDVHTHLHLRTMEFEPGPPHDVPALPPDDAFATANVVPEIAAPSESSPVFRYPLAEALAALRATPVAHDGVRRVRYVNPMSAGSVMPLLDCTLIELQPGVASIPLRTSANAVCAVVAGTGETQIDDTTIAWAQRDIFTLPGGRWITHRSDGPARIFIASDREIYRRLSLLTEELRPAS